MASMDQIYSLGRYVWNTVPGWSTTTTNIDTSNATMINAPSKERKNSITRETMNLPMCMLCRNALNIEKDPKYLDCQHVFCLSCLADIEYSGVITCPECKTPTILNAVGLDGLKSFFAKNDDSKKLFHKQAPREKISISTTNENDEDYESDDEPQLEYNEDLTTSRSDFFDVPLNNSAGIKKKPKSRKPQPASEVPLSHPRSELTSSDEDKILRPNFSKLTRSSTSDSDDFIVLETKPAQVDADYYIPFTQKRELCKTLVKKWLSERWFVPADLEEKLEIVDPRPVYVPFYVFSVTTQTTFSVELGTTNSEGLVSYTPITDRISNTYSELMTCGSHSANIELATKLLNHPGSFSLHSNRILPLDPPPYRSNIVLQEEKFAIDIPVEEAFKNLNLSTVQHSEFASANVKIKKDHKADKTRNFIHNTQIESFEYFVILLPVFFGTFSYSGTAFEYSISGNKGVVEGNRPIGTGWIGKFTMGAVSTVTALMNDQFGINMETPKDDKK